MTQYLDSLTLELQDWAKDYWSEGKVIVRQVPATQVLNLISDETYVRSPHKRQMKLTSKSWEKLLAGLVLSENPKAYLEENRPYGHPTARIKV